MDLFSNVNEVSDIKSMYRNLPIGLDIDQINTNVSVKNGKNGLSAFWNQWTQMGEWNCYVYIISAVEDS